MKPLNTLTLDQLAQAQNPADAGRIFIEAVGSTIADTIADGISQALGQFGQGLLVNDNINVQEFIDAFRTSSIDFQFGTLADGSMNKLFINSPFILPNNIDASVRGGVSCVVNIGF